VPNLRVGHREIVAIEHGQVCSLPGSIDPILSSIRRNQLLPRREEAQRFGARETLPRGVSLRAKRVDAGDGKRDVRPRVERGVGPESEAESVRFHGCRVTRRLAILGSWREEPTALKVKECIWPMKPAPSIPIATLIMDLRLIRPSDNRPTPHRRDVIQVRPPGI
jgi:hypothetical protein